MNAAVPNVGLLLIWFGLCRVFLPDKEIRSIFPSFRYSGEYLMVALERHCTHIGLYLYHHHNKLHAAVPNVGLLLIWFGLCSLFLASKVTVARL